MTEEPVDHIAAVAGTRPPDPLFVYVRPFDHFGNAVLDIGKSFSAPVGRNVINELLAVTGRAPWFGIKTTYPALAKTWGSSDSPSCRSGALRTAVDQH